MAYRYTKSDTGLLLQMNMIARSREPHTLSFWLDAVSLLEKRGWLNVYWGMGTGHPRRVRLTRLGARELHAFNDAASARGGGKRKRKSDAE